MLENPSHRARGPTKGLRCRLSSLLAVNLAVKRPCRRVKRTRSEANALVTVVGREGFEPPTPCASCRCSSQLS